MLPDDQAGAVVRDQHAGVILRRGQIGKVGDDKIIGAGLRAVEQLIQGEGAVAERHMGVLTDVIGEGFLPDDMGGGGHPKGQVAVPGGGALQLVKSLVQLIQGQFDMVVELPPLVVETDVPSHPVKERDAQIRLQAADGGTERGWGDVELCRGGREMLTLCQRLEIVELKQLHKIALLSKLGWDSGCLKYYTPLRLHVKGRREEWPKFMYFR